MALFSDYSIRERKIMNLIANQIGAEFQYTSPNSFDPYDATCVLNGETIYWEQKVRSTHFDSLILEKPKYQKLVQLGASIYCCTTTEGTFIWRLFQNPDIYKWVVTDMPDTTAKYTSYIKKEVTYLNCNQAHLKLNIKSNAIET